MIRLICVKNPKPKTYNPIPSTQHPITKTQHPKPRTPFDFMTFFYHKRIKVLPKETKCFYFVNLNLFQILFSLRYFNNPEALGQHDNVTSGLIGVIRVYFLLYDFFLPQKNQSFTKRNKVFQFCQSEFISDSVFIEMLKQSRNFGTA